MFSDDDLLEADKGYEKYVESMIEVEREKQDASSNLST